MRHHALSSKNFLLDIYFLQSPITLVKPQVKLAAIGGRDNVEMVVTAQVGLEGTTFRR